MRAKGSETGWIVKLKAEPQGEGTYMCETSVC